MATNATPLVLLVEDDLRLAELVRTYLQGNGFRVVVEHRGDNVIEHLQRETPDLVVLDLGLPGRDGFAVCKELRAASDLPILIVTARDNDIDHVVGLEIGADDYVVKPVEPRVLVARIHALLRRSRAAAPVEPRILRFGDLTINATARSVAIGTPTSRCRATNSTCCSSSPAAPAKSSRAKRYTCSSTSASTTASIARSTCASRTCARSSATRARRIASARCGATATCSRPTPDHGAALPHALPVHRDHARGGQLGTGAPVAMYGGGTHASDVPQAGVLAVLERQLSAFRASDVRASLPTSRATPGSTSSCWSRRTSRARARSPRLADGKPVLMDGADGTRLGAAAARAGRPRARVPLRERGAAHACSTGSSRSSSTPRSRSSSWCGSGR